ncbi:hypothetical protein FACS1894113_3730 [Alphaproteobacteria bacterium]|nr:hypothetical protein FACS1894113_3730 [Alphaproteobacteria bacterium]
MKNSEVLNVIELMLKQEKKKLKNVESLEMDELYNLYSKKRIWLEYGLLLTGTWSVLAH